MMCLMFCSVSNLFRNVYDEGLLAFSPVHESRDRLVDATQQGGADSEDGL